MAKATSERRRHKRLDLACPTVLQNADGVILAKAKAANISDGGLYVPVPVKAVPTFGSEVLLAFSVPRRTTNSYMLEEFETAARIVRHEPLKDDRVVGVALSFVKPLSLGLEV